MNTIKIINVEYLRPNRTVETMRIIDDNNIKTVFVFNYEGVHFRVFENIADVYKLVSGNTNIKLLAEFMKEDELDNFLEKELQI